MRRYVQHSQRETSPILEEATTLFSQKREVEIKKELLSAFSQHFVISDEEEESLMLVSTAVDDKFFASLLRLKRIHTDCQVLLGTENQQLGLNLMERSSRSLDSAYQKLFWWIQRELKNLNMENPRISAAIRQSLRVLAERPTLFQSCLDFFAEAREHTLSESFYGALTGSSYSQTDDQTAKPIEYFAHDSLRFVGDMLAWTHSAAVSEHESLEVLFVSKGGEMAKGIKADLESELWSGGITEAFDGQRSLEQLVNRDLTGVARTLRQRVEQVIQSDEDPILAFKVANLIDFYRVTFTRLLGSKSYVLEALASLQQAALRKYRSTMQDRLNSIHLETIHAPSNLDIPEFLNEALGRLKELMKVYDSSLALETSRGKDFLPFLGEALDPFLEGCEKIANRLEEPSTSVFTINCLLAARTAVSTYEFTEDRVAEINDTIEEYALKLIDHQHAYFLHTSGLYPLVVALSPLSDSNHDIKSIPQLEPFQAQSLTDTSQVLDDFLPSALIDAVENLKQLKNLAMSHDITAEAASRFCEDFEFIEGKLVAADRLHGKDDGELQKKVYEDGREEAVALRMLFPRTSAEIRVLLS